MKAIILAAGRGMRLQQPGSAAFPKCLLRFNGQTLLERHLQMLKTAGVDDVVLVLGFEHGQVEAELDRLNWTPRPEIVLNPGFELGSVLSVHTAGHAMRAGAGPEIDILLMDADVLYDERIMSALVAGPTASRLLIDRDFESGDEPVKLCLQEGVPVELRKKVAAGLAFDTIGESVGFFRFAPAVAARLADIVAAYIDTGRANQPHEEAVRDLLLERGRDFDVADVTGAPWIEIDFPDDIRRASDSVLPQLEALQPLQLL
jgi:choline kinase